MAWARLDDRWHDHPKTIAAGLEAAGLWAMCLTWAQQARRTSPTPGVVPDAVVSRFAGTKAKKLAARLHQVGFFDDRTDAGWPIHDFDQYLPKYDPAQAAEAGRKGGKAKAKRTASKPLDEPPSEPEADRLADPSTRASARRNPVPVPTTNSSKSEESPDVPRAEPDPQNGLHRLPDDFRITDAMRRWAVATFPGLDPDYETRQFVSHHRAEGGRKKSWPDEWQKWLRRSAQFASERAHQQPNANGRRPVPAANTPPPIQSRCPDCSGTGWLEDPDTGLPTGPCTCRAQPTEASA